MLRLRRAMNSRQRRDQLRNWRIISERPADVNIAIDIPRPKHKTPPKLERIFPQPMLPMTSRPRPLARHCILAPEKM